MLDNMNIPRPLHPTPDKVREKWVNLNGSWDFSFDLPVFDKEITVPFSWESPLSGIGEERKGTGWYRRYVNYNCGENRLFLHIGAVDYESDVFVNGQHLAHHFGGYTPVTVDVTAVWKNDGENEIIVRAVDYDYNYQTYGKQGYGNCRGIWQTVWLEERPQTYIDHFRITTLISGEITVETDVVGCGDWTIIADFGGVVTESKEKKFSFTIPEPKLWSPEEPNLYEGTLSLKSCHGTDTINTYFGIREVGAARFDDRKRKYITLNGKPVYVNGCLDQSFNAKGYFTFPTDEDCRNEIQQMKDVGLNCARIHIKPEEPRKLYWADKLGLLILEDIPCFWGEPTSVAKAFYEPQMFEVLKRDINHPSIIYWVVFNETWGLFTYTENEDGTKTKEYTVDTQHWVVDCYNKVKTYDPTRLVEDNSVCNRDHTVTDVNTWHFYANGYENTKQNIVDYVESSNVGDTLNFIGEYACTDVPLMNSECGNVWGLDGNAGDSDISWHYKYMMNEFRLHDEVCGFIFTEFRDVINEFNGYYRIDDSKKVFGYEGYVPGMEIKDLHSYDFLATDCEPMKTCKAGEEVSIPLYISSFTDKNHGKDMKVKWELVHDTAADEAVVSSGEMGINYSTYGCTALGDLTVKMPETDGIAKLRLYLTDADDNIVMRNFLVYDVTAEKAVFSADMADFACEGFKRAWVLQQGNKLNCIGEGTAKLTAKKSDIPGYEAGKAIEIRFEAAAKQELTKDKVGEGREISDIEHAFMLGYKVDRGQNSNSFYQTDEEFFPTDITLKVSGKKFAEFHLEDSPSDSRGCLSWHYQPDPRKNDESGSFGYVCTAVITAETADKLPEEFDIEISGKDFSIFGRKSGRYPIGFEIKA